MTSKDWITLLEKFFNEHELDKNWLENFKQIEEFLDKYELDKNWLEDFEKFCLRYDLNLKHITEVLNDPKVIPMIRGKSFEFTVKDYLSSILSEKYYVTNPRLNAQTGFNDIDVSIINKKTGKNTQLNVN